MRKERSASVIQGSSIGQASLFANLELKDSMSRLLSSIFLSKST